VVVKLEFREPQEFRVFKEKQVHREKLEPEFRERLEYKVLRVRQGL